MKPLMVMKKQTATFPRFTTYEREKRERERRGREREEVERWRGKETRERERESGSRQIWYLLVMHAHLQALTSTPEYILYFLKKSMVLSQLSV